MLEAAVAALQQSSPTDWITWLTSTGILACSICCLGWTLSTLTLPNKTQLLLDKGFVDVAISGMKAFELRGVSRLHEVSPCTIWACVTMLATVDLTAPAAKPIVKMLEGIPSALRFLLENNANHIKDFGMTTAGPCSAVCALAFFLAVLTVIIRTAIFAIAFAFCHRDRVLPSFSEGTSMTFSLDVMVARYKPD